MLAFDSTDKPIMSSSKTKRTITVEKSSSDGNVKSKPSVFERLGAPHTFSSSEVCQNRFLHYHYFRLLIKNDKVTGRKNRVIG